MSGQYCFRHLKMNDSWLKQTVDKPLYSDLLWAKPENKSFAGKLAVIGGHSFGFSIPVSAYLNAQTAGAGVVHVLLPASTEKLVGKSNEDVFFAPATSSGGFSKLAISDFIELSSWSDGVYLAGEIGNNSETVVLIENFIDKYDGPLVIANDAVKLATSISAKILARPNTVIVTGIGMLQKLAEKHKLKSVIKHSMNLATLVESLSELTAQTQASFVIEHDEYLFVSYMGYVSTTKFINKTEDWQTNVGAYSAVWLIQNKTKIFEALSCAVIDFQKN